MSTPTFARFICAITSHKWGRFRRNPRAPDLRTRICKRCGALDTQPTVEAGITTAAFSASVRPCAKSAFRVDRKADQSSGRRAARSTTDSAGLGASHQ